MRIVVALGDNALLKRGGPMTADRQRTNIRAAARALAPPAQKHERVSRTGTGCRLPGSGRRLGYMPGSRQSLRVMQGQGYAWRGE